MKEKVKLISDGKRLDGRALDELRPIKIKAGVLERADGSAYIEWGGNKVLAAVYGPQEALPRHIADPYKAVLTYRYNMAPFSVEDRKKPGPDRRSMEISKISREALEQVVILEHFPNTMIKVFVEVLQAEAGTRCAALTAASIALADAGIPMRDLVVACATGKVNGEIILDPGKNEDNFGEADLPLGIIAHTGEIVLMQMDGFLTKDEFDKAVKLAFDGCMKIYEMQKQALKDKYKISKDELEKEIKEKE